MQSKADELEKLKKLLDDGVLTQEEFEKEKQRTLSADGGNQPTSMNPPFIPPVPQGPVRKKSKGCLIGVIVLLMFLGALGFGIVQMALNPEKYQGNSSSAQPTDTPESLLALDESTWKSFVNLYKAHNDFMKQMTAFSDGLITKLDFYTYCEYLRDYCAKTSTTFDYGKTDVEKSYLSTYSSVFIKAQLAAQSMLKYLDDGKTSDLSDAQEHIAAVGEGITLMSENRGVLLVEAGLTMDEITEKVNEDMKALEADRE